MIKHLLIPITKLLPLLGASNTMFLALIKKRQSEKHNAHCSSIKSRLLYPNKLEFLSPQIVRQDLRFSSSGMVVSKIEMTAVEAGAFSRKQVFLRLILISCLFLNAATPAKSAVCSANLNECGEQSSDQQSVYSVCCDSLDSCARVPWKGSKMYCVKGILDVAKVLVVQNKITRSFSTPRDDESLEKGNQPRNTVTGREELTNAFNLLPGRIVRSVRGAFQALAKTSGSTGISLNDRGQPAELEKLGLKFTQNMVDNEHHRDSISDQQGVSRKINTLPKASTRTRWHEKMLKASRQSRTGFFDLFLPGLKVYLTLDKKEHIRVIGCSRHQIFLTVPDSYISLIGAIIWNISRKGFDASRESRCQIDRCSYIVRKVTAVWQANWWNGTKCPRSKLCLVAATVMPTGGDIFIPSAAEDFKNVVLEQMSPCFPLLGGY